MPTAVGPVAKVEVARVVAMEVATAAAAMEVAMAAAVVAVAVAAAQVALPMAVWPTAVARTEHDAAAEKSTLASRSGCATAVVAKPGRGAAGAQVG